MKTKATMFHDVEIWRTGKIRIVSSGYEDRFVVSEVWLIAQVDDNQYRVDYNGDYFTAAKALVRLANLEQSENTLLAAMKAIRESDLTFNLSYKRWSVTYNIRTAGKGIQDGINIATGFHGLNEYGRTQAINGAKNLTAQEWNAIEYWLGKINRKHAENGRPVVPYDIPRRGHEPTP